MHEGQDPSLEDIDNGTLMSGYECLGKEHKRVSLRRRPHRFRCHRELDILEFQRQVEDVEQMSSVKFWLEIVQVHRHYSRHYFEDKVQGVQANTFVSRLLRGGI